MFDIVEQRRYSLDQKASKLDPTYYLSRPIPASNLQNILRIKAFQREEVFGKTLHDENYEKYMNTV